MYHLPYCLLPPGRQGCQHVPQVPAVIQGVVSLGPAALDTLHYIIHYDIHWMTSGEFPQPDLVDHFLHQPWPGVPWAWPVDSFQTVPCIPPASRRAGSQPPQGRSGTGAGTLLSSGRWRTAEGSQTREQKYHMCNTLIMEFILFQRIVLLS